MDLSRNVEQEGREYKCGRNPGAHGGEIFPFREIARRAPVRGRRVPKAGKDQNTWLKRDVRTMKRPMVIVGNFRMTFSLGI